MRAYAAGSLAHLIEDIADHVARAEPGGVKLIGIDGPSGSGKSTLARPLAERLRAPVVPADDFVSWVDLVGWWPRFDEQVVRPLLAGQDAHYQVRDWEHDELGAGLAGWRSVPWAPVVVLEGITTTRRAVADSLACRVWVEAPRDLRLARGVARDGEARRGLWERWQPEEEAFFAADGARDRADFILDTSP